MPKKVNLVHLADGPGGIEVLLPLIIEQIPDKRFDVFVIRKAERAKSVYANMNIPVFYGSDNNLYSYLKILLFAFRRRKEVFHVFNIGPVYLLMLRLAGVKHIVYSIHGTIYWKNSKFRRPVRWLWKLALWRKIRITANSEFSRAEFMRKVSDQVRIEVLGNPIDNERFSLETRDTPNKNIHVVYTGRLVKGKNLPKWIEIAAQVHKAIPNTKFSLYGQGTLEKELVEQISALSAKDFIHIRGFIPKVEEAYYNADVLLFLSEYESFGNVAVEAILCGTPVIASPIPAMKEIFVNYPDFVLDEKTEWSAQVIKKLKNLPRLKSLAAEAREELEQRYSKDNHIMTLRRLYAQLIGKIPEDYTGGNDKSMLSGSPA